MRSTLALAALIAYACASAPPTMVWQNTKTASANYYEDSRDCEKHAEADNSLPAENIAGSVVLGIRLARQEGECMAARGWKLVPAASVATTSGAIETPTAAAVPVTIASAPPGAEIYVDGSFIGNTPLASFRLEPGEHLLEARKAGFTTWSRKITIQTGTPVNVQIELAGETSK